MSVTPPEGISSNSAKDLVTQSEGENGVDFTGANEYQDRVGKTSDAAAAWNAQFKEFEAGKKLQSTAAKMTIPA
ncbi:hypothetical protein [Thalassococcus sp. S3]|uniref:hypothetical protein n=1 Tax=Thalassococcus sp. S3 TaxID=2017482 RepID=UPI00102472FD|nr:hypothetical protein [Thalassococcus sp. S3]QBF33396.1 hypothetical protein CFI11_19590 [Thalassococcus sp. S3]